MFAMTTELWFVFIFVFLLFMLAISSFCFIKISVKHIEQELKKEGINPPEWDSRIGYRYGWYAIVIVRNSISPVSIVNDEAVLRVVRKKDRYLALVNVIIWSAFMIVGLIIYCLYVPKS